MDRVEAARTNVQFLTIQKPVVDTIARVSHPTNKHDSKSAVAPSAALLAFIPNTSAPVSDQFTRNLVLLNLDPYA